MKKVICLLIIIFTLFSNGCIQQTEQTQLEDVGWVEVMGYDIGKDGKMQVTVAYPQIEDPAEAKTQIYSKEVDLTHEAITQISKKSDKALYYGQLRVILFSEDFARQQGLEEVLNELYRDPIVGNNVLIAIVKGKVQDYLTNKDPEKPPITTFLTNLLKPRRETYFNPFTTIHDFIYNLTNEISDPMTPYLRKSGNEIEITEIAIFKGNKMIDTITPWESNLLYGLAQRKRMAAIKIKSEVMSQDKESYLMLEFVQSDVKIKSNKDIQNPKVNIQLDFKGQLYGHLEDEGLENPEIKQALEKEISRKIQSSIYDLLEYIQKLQVDPIQLGEAFRMHYRGEWTKEVWNEILPEVEFNVKVTFEITSQGTLK